MNNRRLYVGNVSYDATEADIRDLFSDFTVKEVKIVMDRETRRPRGFVFVELANDGEANDAVARLNETNFMGRDIRVSIAEDRKSNSNGSSGGRRDRRDQR